MTKEKDCRSKKKQALVRKESLAGPTTLHDIPNRLLELILLHLTSPLWLVHAAATCKRWRRIVADTTFLAGLHCRHPAPLAGHYHYHASPVDGRSPVFIPSSPKLAVDSRHFSLDFVPGGGGSRAWELVDSLGSLLLLAKRRTGWRRHCFRDLLVCEPVTRCYKLIPRMEQMKYHHCLGIYLHGNENIATMYPRIPVTMSRFRVICLLYERYTGVSDDVGTVRACVFDLNRRRHWESRSRPGWYVARGLTPKRGVRLHGTDPVHFLGRVKGSLFWGIKDDNSVLLVLHEWSAEFAVLHLPDHIRGLDLRVIDDSGYGNVRVVCLEGNNLRVFVTALYGNSASEWVLLKSLRLMEAACGLAGYKDEYFGGTVRIATAGVRSITVAPAEETWLFSVDLETMEVAECKHTTNRYASVAYPCELPWPPALHACKVRCRRGRLGLCSHICIC